MCRHLTGTAPILMDSSHRATGLAKLLLYTSLVFTAAAFLIPTGSHAAVSADGSAFQATITPEIAKRGALQQHFREAKEALEVEDLERGHELLRLLAEQGHVDAQFMLGIIYSSGVGLPEDMGRAAHWYRQAAEQGHVDAQYNLGVAYSMGSGVVADSMQAASWYEKAAYQGSTDAQFNLGLLYAQGDGVSKDMLEAAKWWYKAAAKGDAAAQYALGLMYVRGDGVAQNIDEALKWW
ncbi:MAG: tetratricopeptide repeat protein, partial [Acidiferrobacterales bacterium]|nr:tetratricopeptide repeat protein [Acidiferrobacterales bacterium]